MNICKLLRIWFLLKDIRQKEFANINKISTTNISEILKGIKKNIPIDFKEAFQNQFGFPVEDVYLHIKSELEKEKKPQENKSKVSEKIQYYEKKLYCLENLSEERFDQLQEMIYTWLEEDIQKHRKKRIFIKEPKSKKNHKTA